MKPHPHKLINLNPSFTQMDGFYSPPHEDEVKVTFTEADQELVAGLLSGLDDASADSEEFESIVGNGEYLSVLKPQALSSFNYQNIKTALEVSEDYGNYCRYLAEKIESVDVIKRSQNAAKASSYRCSDLSNVDIVLSDVLDLELPQQYYDLILLSDIETLVDSVEQIPQIIAALSKSLSQDGVLVLSCQNAKPISAWFDSEQMIPYSGLYGTLKNRLQPHHWNKILSDAGFDQINDYAVLPNSDNPRTILSRSYIEENEDAVNHFYGSGLIRNDQVNEYLLFNELIKHQQLFDLADSYWMIVGKSNADLTQFFNNDFSHFSSPGRRRKWRTVTTKLAGSNSVNKALLFEDQKALADNPIKQDRSAQEFKAGQSLAGKWLQCLVDGSSSNQLDRHITDYHSWLIKNSEGYKGALYDILPFNLIVNERGDYQVIDPEWDIQDDITSEFVLFRALFWFGFHNRHLLKQFALNHGLFSLEDFVEYGLKRVGYKTDISAFAKKETDIQSLIEKQFNQDAIEETLRQPIIKDRVGEARQTLPKAQIFWYDQAADVDFNNSVVEELASQSGFQTVRCFVGALDTTPDMLRVDPVDVGGFISIKSISIVDKDANVLWQTSDFSEAKLENITVSEEVFTALNDDPQIIFDVSETDLAQASYLDIELKYQSGSAYQLAMEQLGDDVLLQKQFIRDQRNDLEALRARYSELNDNFEFLKEVSEKQHESIEKQKNRLMLMQKQMEEKQKTIDVQNEMMMRKPSTRIKLFIARMLGKNDQAAEVEELQEAIAEQKAQPDKLGQTNEDYALWVEQNKLSEEDIARIKSEIEQMPLKPVFSIVVPVYNIDEEFMMLAVDSVRNQLYPYWELCLVDDASPKNHIRPMLKRLTVMDERIVVKLNKNNQGIAGASNDGVKLTSGDFVGLLDHDDELTIDALYENAKVINDNPNVGFIYSDEDKMTMDERRVDPFFKPDYSPDLLDSQNYICHFSVMSQSVLQKIDGFRLGYDGSQDHDIIIRAIQNSDQVVHIPKVLYHWRKVPGSTAEVYDAKSYAWEAGRKAVESRLQQNGEEGEVVLGPLQGTFQVKRYVVGNPKISIIIPFKDKPELLETCVNSILQRAEAYPNFEIVGVSNNSEEEETYALMSQYSEQNPNIKFIELNESFNFSKLCNFGVSQSSGEYVLLLNNDIEIISDDWLERLLEHAQRKEIGAVGGKLYFPDGRIQHAGVVIGMHGAAGHSHLFFSANDIGYYGSLMVTRNVSAVTGAMLMVSREKYDEVEGLDENNLAVAYNDVDLCLKLLDQGYRNIFTPFCQATHYESASRGYEDDPIKQMRFEKERNFFLGKWQDFLQQGDPSFNPNFDLSRHDFSIKLEDCSDE